MRLLSVLLGGREVTLERFLTAMCGTDSTQAAAILNDSLQRGHMTFEPHGDDLVLQVTEEGRVWLAKQIGDEPGGWIALADQADAELRDSTEEDDQDDRDAD
jgi:hypothetical protein